MDIWSVCEGEKQRVSISGQAWRVVEAQHISSTRKLTDTAQEHQILEDLLESKAKPPLPTEALFNQLHYLLKSPFRYPPLQHGSRFARCFERSLWYGSRELPTALSEVAFYRMLFFDGTTAKLSTSGVFLTAYTVKLHTTEGILLTQSPFLEHASSISAKNSYENSQVLGTAMRKAGIVAFDYFSARDPQGINIGVFCPSVFVSKSPEATSYQTWFCYTDGLCVEFLRQASFGPQQRHVFLRKDLFENHSAIQQTQNEPMSLENIF